MLKVSWDKKQKTSVSDLPGEFTSLINELIKRNDKGITTKVYYVDPGSSGGYNTLVADMSLKDWHNEDPELLLKDSYGGGRFNVKIFQKISTGANDEIASFKFSIAGATKLDKNNGDQRKESTLVEVLRDNSRLMLDVADKMSNKELLNTLLGGIIGNNHSSNIDEFLKLFQMTQAMAPQVKSDDGIGAIIPAAAQVLSSIFSARGVNPQQFAQMQQAQQLQGVPPPGGESQMQLPPPVTQPVLPAANLGNISIGDKQKAGFEAIFLEEIRELIRENASAEEIGAKIYGAIAISMVWTRTNIHPVMEPLVEALEQNNITAMDKAYKDFAVKMGLIDEIRQGEVKSIIMQIYMSQVQRQEQKEAEVTNEQAV